MNARGKGYVAGFAYALSIIGGSGRHFEAIGMKAAKAAYKRPEKQQEFLAGWMENWAEPHAKDCWCEQCKAAESIETY
jgi:hypothetical protein